MFAMATKLAPGSKVIGIDVNPQFVAKATEQAKLNFFGIFLVFTESQVSTVFQWNFSLWMLLNWTLQISILMQVN